MTEEELRERFELLRAQQRQHIAQFGQSLMGVFGDETSPPFTYTIGNPLRGSSELLLIGMNIQQAHGLLNQLAQMRLDRGREFQDDELVSLGEGAVPLKIVNVAPKFALEYTRQAANLLETEDYLVQQVVLPDPQGRYPGDPDCEEPYASFPVLRTTH